MRCEHIHFDTSRSVTLVQSPTNYHERRPRVTLDNNRGQRWATCWQRTSFWLNDNCHPVQFRAFITPKTFADIFQINISIVVIYFNGLFLLLHCYFTNINCHNWFFTFHQDDSYRNEVLLDLVLGNCKDHGMNHSLVVTMMLVCSASWRYRQLRWQTYHSSSQERKKIREYPPAQTLQSVITQTTTDPVLVHPI